MGTLKRSQSCGSQSRRADVVEQGAGGVGGIGGENFSAGEAVEEVGVDGSEECFAGFEFLAEVGVFVEESGEFWGGEVAVDFEAGFVGDEIVCSGGGRVGADVIAAAALPDDGVVERPAGGAVEDDECLALVGDGEAGGSRCFRRAC